MSAVPRATSLARGGSGAFAPTVGHAHCPGSIAAPSVTARSVAEARAGPHITREHTPMATSTTAAHRSKQDAIAMLKADHQRVHQLVEQFKKARDDERKGKLAERICQELEVHAQLEEEVFYPAVRDAIDKDDLMDEAEVEHASAKDLIRQIKSMSPGDDMYDAKVTVLGEYVDHHVEEEEKEMFPKARKAKVDVAELGRKMAERRQQLEAQNAMVPFDSIASMLMMPIRAVASAGRKAVGASQRATASAGEGRAGRKAGAKKPARASTSRAGATVSRASGGAARAASGAASGAKRSAASGRSATGVKRAAAGTTTRRASGERAAASSGKKASAGRKAAGAATARGTARKAGARGSKAAR